MTQAFSGGVTLKRGDGADPEVFTIIPEMSLAPVLGVDKGVIEVSNYDSVDNKEYITEYLGDGKDVDMEWNYRITDLEQKGVISDVALGKNRNYMLTVTDGINTITSTFTLTPKGWARPPSFTEAHKLTASFKISGAIVDVVTP